MATNFYSELESAYSLLDIEENIGEDLFVDDPWDELASHKTFSCSICGKMFKTKRGLDRHEGNHRAVHSVEIMDVTSWHNLIKTAVDKIVDEDLQSDEILEELKAFTIKSEDNCLLHFHDCIGYVFSLEKFYPMFYRVVTQIGSIQGLSRTASIVVGFELANHVIAYYKSLKEVQQSTLTSKSSLGLVGGLTSDHKTILSERDVSVVVYIGGYIFSNLYRRLRKVPCQSDLIQQKLLLLKAGKIEIMNENDTRYALVKCRDRGGLWYVSDDVINILIEAEKEFQYRTKGFTVKIIYDDIVKNVIDIDMVQSSMKNMESLYSFDTPVEDETTNNFLDQIILQYIRVRAHSFAKDQVDKHKHKFVISSGKALRTELKRSGANK